MKRSGMKQSVYRFPLNSNSNSKNKDYFVITIPRNDNKKRASKTECSFKNF